MSLTPGVSGTGPATGGISDVVSQDDLTRWAQIAGILRYLTAPVTSPAAPSSPVPISPLTVSAVFQNMYYALTNAGVDAAVAHIPAAETAKVVGGVGHWTALIVQFCMLFIGDALNIVLGVLDGIRKGLDPQVGELAVTVLNEFLGTDFTNVYLPVGISTADHITRARAIGALLFGQLEKEFISVGGGAVQPSLAPAQSFSGLAVNFGLASGIMGLIGGAIPIGHVEELRELGEEVAKNIGLGRLVRRALNPLIQTLVAQPAQWAINTKYLPTQYTEAMLVNPYAATLLPQEQLYNAMHLLGYSNDKIEAFIKMHQKRLRPSDVKLLLDHGQWTPQQADDYLKTLGWPAEMQPTVLLVEELLEERTWIARLVDEMEAEVKAGRMTLEEFTNVINGTPTLGAGPGPIGSTGLPFSEATKQIIIATTAFKARAIGRPKRLSGGELFYAFAAGLLTDTEIRDLWTAEGLPAADQDLRMELWLLHLNRLSELEKEKLAGFERKQQTFLEKKAGQKPVPQPPVPPVPPFPLG